ncbi:transcriptional regulator [Priestia megaterium]|jgi:DNA-binding Xre family transcriptional regulator|uniref:helix-turn-helix domain-containing protein n=1 Tax=Priestia megaterium TaxID=1404 RepID=UPI000BFC5E51|nr:helix-turn-helix transcriptional regulator [Priestia megaterium]MCY9026525.1 helix-turn-helix transcriptional regulator [Priestia megaterium]PGR17378.1 transcriptional regulator [Priestia megaterium]
MNYDVKPRLGEILKERELRQKDLAKMSNLTEATISRFERQSRYEISTLVAISKALDLSIEDLFVIKKSAE